MALIDIITQAAGAGALEQIGARVGLTPAQTRSAAAALLPSLAGGMKRQAGGGLGDLLTRTGVGEAPKALPGIKSWDRYSAPRMSAAPSQPTPPIPLALASTN